MDLSTNATFNKNSLFLNWPIKIIGFALRCDNKECPAMLFQYLLDKTCTFLFFYNWVSKIHARI